MLSEVEEKRYNIIVKALETYGIKVHKNGPSFPKRKFEIRV